MKKLILILLAGVFLLGACSSTPEPDYTTEQLESALNDGENPEGKIVSVKVDELVPDSAFGYNIQTGEHLNFVSSENPDVKVGDEIVVKVEKVESLMGSYIITYEQQ
ncbi:MULTISPECIES: hypothetical protein [Bhargavaea]|uniref:DUF3221 domain-containing protein n=1 Tax=Bhargavaea changchunensis TaxID=2134037 RepID=A0ABW2NEN4_9BACL|nr:hypothetical protein [Bhargavaea sp. CC-171006]